MFLTQPVLAEMLLQMLPPPPRVWGPLALSEVARGEQALACPQCKEAMKPTKIHDVELDHCPKHGVWFDQDELRITLYRVADPKNPPPFEEWGPSPFAIPKQAPPKPIPPPPPSTKPGVRTLVFRVVQQGRPPREVATQNEVIKVGKIASCHLRIENDDSVSRMHAVIEVTRDEITIIDLGSSSGTYVDGAKITKSKIEVGSTIRVGDTDVVLISAT